MDRGDAALSEGGEVGGMGPRNFADDDVLGDDGTPRSVAP
jgi:hypothetical protein